MWKQYVGFLIYCRRYVWHIITYLFVCFWRNNPQWAVLSLGAGIGSLVDRAEVVDVSVEHLRNNFQVPLRR